MTASLLSLLCQVNTSLSLCNLHDSSLKPTLYAATLCAALCLVEAVYPTNYIQITL